MDETADRLSKAEYDSWWAYNDLHCPSCYQCEWRSSWGANRCPKGQHLHDIWHQCLIDLNEYLRQRDE